MGSVGNRALLVLALILVVISVFGTYMVLTVQITPVAPSSTTTGVVSLEILSKQPPSPPSTDTGVVSIEILKSETGD